MPGRRQEARGQERAGRQAVRGRGGIRHGRQAGT